MKIYCFNLKYFFAALFLLFSLENYAQEVPKLRIDPSQAYGGNVSEYFETVEYIPLETTKESLFGQIGMLIITDSSYVIKDYDTGCNLFFSRDGKFIKKIKSKAFIVFDKINNRIVFFDFTDNSYTNASVDYYSLKGDKISSPKTVFNTSNSKSKYVLQNPNILPLEDNFYAVFNNYHYLFTNEKDLLKSDCNFITIYKKDSVYKELILLPQKNKLATSKIWGTLSRPDKIDNGYFYVSSPLDYFLYKVNKDTAVKLFQFVFPSSRTLSKNILESNDNKLIETESNNLRFSQEFIVNVENVYFIKNLLFFKIHTPSYQISYNGSENKYQYNFIYDTSTSKLSSIDRITPDSSSCFLPIMGERSKNQGVINYKNNLYAFNSSLLMFTTHEATKDKKPQYPTVLKEYFKTQDRKSNPVIVRFKYKD